MILFSIRHHFVHHYIKLVIFQTCNIILETFKGPIFQINIIIFFDIVQDFINFL